MSEAQKFFMLKNVRISFPHLFDPSVFDGEEGKYGATLLLDEKDHAKVIAELKKEIEAMSKAKFKMALPPDRTCLRLGAEKRPEYEGTYALSGLSKAPIVVLNAMAQIVTDKAKNPVYAGCYVNAKVSFWVQDNKYGKRINCNLAAVQFAADGEALDGSYIPVDVAAEGFSAAVGDDFMD